jgi:tyrosyl-tRNA synthetase
MTNDFISTLHERGFINQTTNREELDVLSKANAVQPYIGFDLTADSLHVGSLIQLMVLRWAETTNIGSTVLFGEFTTRVGDPTGRKDARPVLSDDTIARNRVGIHDTIFGSKTTMSAILDKSLHNTETNDNWLKNMPLLEYLTEYAATASVNRMLAMDSVKDRLADTGHMSVLEFNYSLFQAIDFLHLNDAGCNLQIGGSDQWSNILSGIDLIRRKNNRTAYGLTTPLMTNAAGEKMGKTAGGAIWLSAAKTPVDEFWQFWRNVEDEKVGQFLGLFTEFPMEEVERLRTISGQEINEVKKMLATEVTRIVHGDDAAKRALANANAAFEGGDFSTLSLVRISGDHGSKPISHVVAVLAGVSKSEALRLITQGGVKLDGTKLEKNFTLGDIMPSEVEFRIDVGKKSAFRVIMGGYS